MDLRGIAAAVLLSGLAAACSLPPSDSRHLTLASHSLQFIDQADAGLPLPTAAVDGYLLWPDADRHPPPWPAMVILHTSNGQGAQDWAYVRRLADLGVAALAVDSFSGRGVDKTVADQTLVSASSMMADAYTALGRLAADPRVDRERIGVLGFSKGGIAALYAVFERYRAALAVEPDQRFALHVAYYPWCGVTLLEARTTGAPVVVHVGTRDSVSPPALCQAFVERVRAADPSADLMLNLHAGARHAFDHPMLDWFGSFPTSGSSPTRCRLIEVAAGVFEEQHSGLRVDGSNLGPVLAACSAEGALVGGHAEAAADAWAITLAAIQRYLVP